MPEWESFRCQLREMGCCLSSAAPPKLMSPQRFAARTHEHPRPDQELSSRRAEGPMLRESG